jgi:hypothetical protein
MNDFWIGYRVALENAKARLLAALEAGETPEEELLNLKDELHNLQRRIAEVDAADAFGTFVGLAGRTEAEPIKLAV